MSIKLVSYTIYILMERALVDIAVGEIALGGNMKFLEPQFPILTIHD